MTATLEGYLMPNPDCKYILDIYDLQIHIVDNIFKRTWAHFFK